MPAWVVFASLGMGFLAAVLGHLAWEAFGPRRVHRDHERYVEQVVQASWRAVTAGAEHAAADAELARLLGRVPPDFQPALLRAAQLGYQVEAAVMADAVRRGIAGAPPRPLGAPESAPDAPRGASVPEAAASGAQATQAPPSNGAGAALGAMVWDGGRLVPVRRAP